MCNRVSLFILLALAAGTACHKIVDTMPPPVSPAAAVRYYDLEIPPDLEIRSADYSVTALSDVSGTNGSTSSLVTGRAFIKVFAVHRITGEQMLLVYEDIEHRKQPIQVIRFRRGPASSGQP